jgi:AraC family transcriptional activator of mtrCDE
VGCGTVDVRYGEAVGLFDHLSQTLVVDLSSIPEIPFLYQGILSEQADGQPGSPVLQGAIMMQLLVHLFRKLSPDSETSLPWLAALDDPRLAAALDAIIKNPGAHHTVESLAEIAHMSRSTFAKSFHEAFDRSPISLVNYVRMEHAARMLSTGQIPVEQVASRVGFSSRSHFYQAFKKHKGMTPVEYRSS